MPPKENAETCPSFRSGHLPAEDDVQRLQLLSEPHVGSFDFFLESGLKKAIGDITRAEIDVVDPKADEVDLDSVNTVHFWIENVKVASPATSQAGQPKKLYPRQCRELGMMYSGQITGDFCYEVVQRRNGMKIKGNTIRLKKSFGDMPIMVLSKACHLKGKSPLELADLREEVGLCDKVGDIGCL